MVTVGYMIWKSGQQRIQITELGQPIDGSHRLDEHTEREAFILRSCKWLTKPPATQKSVKEGIFRLGELMGVDAEVMALETRRFQYMTEDELQTLSKLGCTVELHGHKHQYFGGNTAAIGTDISICRNIILKKGLPEPKHYCYPSGEFDEDADKILPKLNIKTATTCQPGHITQGKDKNKPYFLPRFWMEKTWIC